MFSGPIAVIVLLIAVIAFLVVVFGLVIPLPLWFAAVLSGVWVSPFSMVGMRLRRIPPQVILSALIQAKKAGLNITSEELEKHFLAGGDVFRVIYALVASDKANIGLGIQQATAIDLAGRNVLDAVRMSVNPRVIETPRIAAVARDGIQLIAYARVTVRANIDRLVGGAGEETVIARVGEGIVSAIGNAESYKDVLENPDRISKTVLGRGLDSGTAFEILSIDIADIDVGKNIGAELQMDQANADKDIAQAKAEERRSMAVAQEQEMRALETNMRSKLVAAKAEIPMSIADALASGRLSIMDYYKMKNIIADTDMRQSIAGGEENPQG